jgi:hypothetical protein
MLRGLLVVALASGCLRDELVQCANGTSCPVGSVCTDTGCARLDELEACEGRLDGDGCQRDGVTGQCSGGLCVLARCGDGMVNASEACDGAALTATCEDEGYYTGALACADDCTLDVSGCAGQCGDGTVDTAEACDGISQTSCFDLGFSFGRSDCIDCQLGTEPCSKYGWRQVQVVPSSLYTGWWAGDRFFAIDYFDTVYELGPGTTMRAWRELFRTPLAVSGTSPTDVYVASDEAFHHFDGANWTPVPGTGLVGYDCVSVVSADRILVGGRTNEGPAVAIFDGTSWSTYPARARVNSIAGTATEVWIADNLGLSHFDGADWTALSSPERYSAVAVSGDEVIATGERLATWTGTSFTPVLGIGSLLYGFSLGNGTFAAGTSIRDLYETDGRIWGRTRAPSAISSSKLVGAGLDSEGHLAVLSATQFYISDARLVDRRAEGPSGKLLWAFNGAVWEDRAQYLTRNGETIAGIANRAVAWGTVDPSDGEVLFISSQITVSTNDVERCTRAGCELTGLSNATVLSGSSATNVWTIVGAKREVHHYDGASWTLSYAHAGNELLFDISAVAPDDIYVIGSGNLLLHYDGTAWTPMELPLMDDDLLRKVEGFPGGRAIAVSIAGVYELAGGVWTRAFSSNGFLTEVTGRSPDDAIAIGDGVNYLRDEHGWLAMEPFDLDGAANAIFITDDALWVSAGQTFTRITPRPR